MIFHLVSSAVTFQIQKVEKEASLKELMDDNKSEYTLRTSNVREKNCRFFENRVGDMTLKLLIATNCSFGIRGKLAFQLGRVHLDKMQKKLFQPRVSVRLHSALGCHRFL